MMNIKIISSICVLAGAIVLNAFHLSAQDRSRLKLSYHKEMEERKLEASILVRIDRRYSAVEDLPINFYYVKDSSRILLGSMPTDEQGDASIIIDEEQLDENFSGAMLFEAEFTGNDSIASSSRELEITDVLMDVQFAKTDDRKVIIVTASEIGMEGEIPIDNVNVNIYVPRTFTLLKVGGGSLDKGSMEIDFPTDLPGDSLGYLDIVAKIENHELYGTTATRDNINWGKPVEPQKPVDRGLGDTNAPLWMVYTLIVLLSVVWFHYLYVIFSIYRIKREGDKYKVNLHEDASKLIS